MLHTFDIVLEDSTELEVMGDYVPGADTFYLQQVKQGDTDITDTLQNIPGAWQYITDLAVEQMDLNELYPPEPDILDAADRAYDEYKNDKYL